MIPVTSTRKGIPVNRTLTFRGHGGLSLAADAWGDPSSQPVVLLHGGGQTRHAWGGTAQVLGSEGWHAISVDLRGHGDSEWAEDGDYSLEAMVGDVRGIAASLDSPPAIVGASMGGIMALIATGEQPSVAAAALVLVDVAHRSDPVGVDRIIRFMTGSPDGFATLEQAAEAVADYLPHRPRPRNLEGLRKNLRLGPDRRFRWHWDPRFMTGDRRPNAARNPDRLADAARNLRLPTLLVRGRMSDILSEELAKDFLSIVPDARYVDVSGAGHMVAGDENDVFTEAVAGFLAEVAPPRPHADTQSG